MLQSVLRKMCVFMWILTLSLNYIRSRNVDEAKFVFWWCLFKKYIPDGKTSSRGAEVPLVSPLEQFSISFYRHCSQAARCPVVTPALLTSIAVMMMMMLLLCFITWCSCTTLHICWLSLFQPNQHRRCLVATCCFSRVVVWLCGAALFWRSATLRPVGYSTLVSAEHKLKEKKKTCVELFEKYSFSRRYFPQFKAINRANAVSHCKIIYFHQTSFQSEKWKFALLRFGTINRK